MPGTPYEVTGLLGVGGMGTVYEVRHLELGRALVLKVLHEQLATRGDLGSRMKNEWTALASLEHPHIVQVTDAGYTRGGLPYYVMERLEGQTVGQLLRASGPLEPARAVALSLDVLSGLSAAHERGVIHRDVKPQNVFVLRDGRAKILDFGIAQMTSQAARVVTAVGVAIGTPRYMAPEQAEGRRVDGRADIYAVGLVLYEMLLGRGPFAELRDPNQLVMAHIARVPERLDRLAPHLPSELGDLLQRWLAKLPEERPWNAAAARRELAALQGSLLPSERTATDEITLEAAYEAPTVGPEEPQWSGHGAGERARKGSGGPSARELGAGPSTMRGEGGVARLEQGAAREKHTPPELGEDASRSRAGALCGVGRRGEGSRGEGSPDTTTPTRTWPLAAPEAEELGLEPTQERPSPRSASSAGWALAGKPRDFRGWGNGAWILLAAGAAAVLAYGFGVLLQRSSGASAGRAASEPREELSPPSVAPASDASARPSSTSDEPGPAVQGGLASGSRGQHDPAESPPSASTTPDPPEPERLASPATGVAEDLSGPGGPRAGGSTAMAAPTLPASSQGTSGRRAQRSTPAQSTGGGTSTGRALPSSGL